MIGLGVDASVCPVIPTGAARRSAACISGLAFGLALAVRSAGSAEVVGRETCHSSTTMQDVLRRLTCDILPPSDLRQSPCFGHAGATFPRDVASGRPGLALVVLSVVEQRLDAVRAVLDGAEVVEVAARVGVHRSTVHRWVARYLTGQLAGLADRSHRPHSSPGQAAEVVEAAV